MKNLRAEMKRKGVSVADIRATLACSEKTARNKVNGRTEFGISQATLIRDIYFLGMRLEYLFASDEPTDKAS